MNDTHDLNRQPTIDPHIYDMPAAERAAYANGFGAGKRSGDAEIARLRADRVVLLEALRKLCKGCDRLIEYTGGHEMIEAKYDANAAIARATEGK